MTVLQGVCDLLIATNVSVQPKKTLVYAEYVGKFKVLTTNTYVCKDRNVTLDRRIAMVTASAAVVPARQKCACVHCLVGAMLSISLR